MHFGPVNSYGELQPQVNYDFVGPANEGWAVISMDKKLVFNRNEHEHLCDLHFPREK